MKINSFTKKFLLAILLTSATWTLSGCSNSPTYEKAKESKLIETNYQAAESLLRNLKNPLNIQQTIRVQSLVNNSKASEKTMLGRVIAEQLSARFAKAGYKMVDILDETPPAPRSENLQLTDDTENKENKTTDTTQAILTGTYSVSQNYVYVTIKLIHPQTNVLIATYNYVLPLDSNIETLTRTPITTGD